MGKGNLIHLKRHEIVTSLLKPGDPRVYDVWTCFWFYLTKLLKLSNFNNLMRKLIHIKIYTKCVTKEHVISMMISSIKNNHIFDPVVSLYFVLLCFCFIPLSSAFCNSNFNQQAMYRGMSRCFISRENPIINTDTWSTRFDLLRLRSSYMYS